MKKITLNLNVDENKLLDKELTQLMKDTAKTISRNIASQAVDTEVKRVVSEHVKKYMDYNIGRDWFRNLIRDELNGYRESSGETLNNYIRQQIIDRVRELGGSEWFKKQIEESVRDTIVQIVKETIKLKESVDEG